MPYFTVVEWTLILGAVGSAVGSLVAALKTLAEAREIRARVQHSEHERAETAQIVTETRDQLKNNGGSSFKDSFDALVVEVGKMGADLRGMRRDIGRLASVDLADREESTITHAQIWDELKYLRGRGE